MSKTKSKRSNNQTQTPAIIEVTLIPETWILSPKCTEEQLKRYYKKGWIDKEGLHLDRCFPRDAYGNPILFKLWLLAPMKRALRKLGYSKEVLKFSIVDENNNPVEYIKIPEKPLRYRRAILNKEGLPESTESFEYVDSTYELKFRVLTPYPREFCEVLALAGRIGLMSSTRKGFGKFIVKFKTL